MWNQMVLPALVSGTKCDIVVYMESMIPFVSRGCRVVVIYDLSFLKVQGEFDQRTRRIFKSTIAGTVRRASAIIAISESTKRDVVDTLDVPSSKVHVIRLGFSSAFSEKKDLNDERREALFRRLGIHDRYMLMIGSTHAHKNIGRLIEAYHIVASRPGMSSLQLVVAGMITPNTQLNIEDEKKRGVILTGYLPDDELYTITLHAQLFCLPSLYEGFGIPILEAMSVGVPVIGSNVSSIPEVIGEAGLLFNPYDPADIAAKAILALGDGPLRKRLIEAGRTHLTSFTWRGAAETFLQILRQLS